MLIHYGFSYIKINQYYKTYRKAVAFLELKGHKMSNNYLEQNIRNSRAKKQQPPSSKKYLEILNSLEESNVCIFDVSVRAMALGQHVNISLKNKKPTLVLNNINVGRSLYELFIAGTKSPYLTLRNYTTEEEMLQHIDEFIERNKGPRTQRMTLLLDNWMMEDLRDEAERLNSNLKEVLESRIDTFQKNITS